MIQIFFPYVTQLHIFQLEEYSPIRFLRWIAANPFKRSDTSKKKLVWTSKAKNIFYIAVLCTIVINILLVFLYRLTGLVIGMLLATQPYIFLILGLAFLKPKEILNRNKVKKGIRSHISVLKQNKLKVIGVAGSYGKTSVKEFLYSILRTKYKVLRTPESYNTLFGISKVVEYELDDRYDYFICEMGAYKIGEIREICEMVLPDHSILTGINEQHIDRFKKIENTIKAKFEIVEYSSKTGVSVLNGANEHIRNNYSKYKSEANLYGVEQNGFYVKDIKPTKLGCEFIIVLKGKEHKASTRLIGKSNIENILAAATMGTLLDVEPNLIIEAIGNLKPLQHRLEIKYWHNGLTVIDDAYSSNITGFKAALELLGTFDSLERIIVTPGIVELGSKTKAIHNELGTLADINCDKILLVGKNERTLALNEGINHKEKVTFISSLSELQNHVTNPNKTIVLIENDLPDNY